MLGTDWDFIRNTSAMLSVGKWFKVTMQLFAARFTDPFLKVEKILTRNGRTVEVRTADGSEHNADIIISNADGSKTIMNMLEGRYINDRIRKHCAEPQDETN